MYIYIYTYICIVAEVVNMLCFFLIYIQKCTPTLYPTTGENDIHNNNKKKKNVQSHYIRQRGKIIFITIIIKKCAPTLYPTTGENDIHNN